MTDTTQDLSTPPAADPVPAPTDTAGWPTDLSQRGRPSKVVQRDLAIARLLAESERSKHEVMAALDLPWRVTYNSLCRLRDQGLVELNRNGTRTPTWRVTDKGYEWLGTAAPNGEAPTPPPAPEPAPEPAPVAEVPAPEPGAEPVPIAPPPEPEPAPAPVAEVPQPPVTPEPEQPGTVAPSPGPAEPVWPI